MYHKNCVFAAKWRNRGVDCVPFEQQGDRIPSTQPQGATDARQSQRSDQ